MPKYCLLCGCKENNHLEYYSECLICGRDECDEFQEGGTQQQFLEKQIEIAVGALQEIEKITTKDDVDLIRRLYLPQALSATKVLAIDYNKEG